MAELKDLFNTMLSEEYAKGVEVFDSLIESHITKKLNETRAEVAASMLNVKPLSTDSEASE